MEASVKVESNARVAEDIARGIREVRERVRSL